MSLPTREINLDIASNLNFVPGAINQIMTVLKARALEERALFNIRLAVEEALINAIKHGNRCDRSLNVHLDVKIDDEALNVTVRDEGPGFDYKNRNYDVSRIDNLIALSGRGIFLMEKVMDKIEYNAKGNQVTMTKFLT